MTMALPMLAQYNRHPGRPLPAAYSRDYRPNRNAYYYGLRLGAAFSTVNSDDPRLDGGTMQTGLNVGMVVGFQLHPTSPVCLETGLFYTEKGGKGRYDGKKFTYNLNYIEVPLLLKYQIDVERKLSIQPFLGGYLACGVGGKIKDYGNRTAFSSFDDDAFRRFDGGLRLGCGLQYDIIYVEAAYEFGLANICNDSFETSHNRCLYVNCGVNF
jgi:hypothetical protein